MAIKKQTTNSKTTYEVMVKVRDQSGRQKTKKRKNISSLVLAQKIEYQLKLELEGFRSKILWSKWVEKCLERCRLEYKNSTFLNYKTTLEKWVNPHWNARFIDEITTSDVHELIFNTVEGVSSWHRKNVLKYVRRIFMMAVEDGVLQRNPSLKIKVKVPQAVQKVLNPKEIAILLKQAKVLNHDFYEIWSLALLTGMRNGELYALKWSDVDMESRMIHVTKAWTSKDGFGPTKSAKNRVVPMSPECLSFLKELKLQRGHEEFVLPHFVAWTKGNQAKILKEFCEGIEITPVKFHDLRATFITQLMRNGVALAKVMAIVGHSELKTTQGYLRLCGQDVVGATDALGIKLPEDVERGKILTFSS